MLSNVSVSITVPLEEVDELLEEVELELLEVLLDELLEELELELLEEELLDVCVWLEELVLEILVVELSTLLLVVDETTGCSLN